MHCLHLQWCLNRCSAPCKSFNKGWFPATTMRRLWVMLLKSFSLWFHDTESKSLWKFICVYIISQEYIHRNIKNQNFPEGFFVGRGNVDGFVSFQIQRDALISFICLHCAHIINNPEVSTDNEQKECRLTSCLRSEHACAWAVLTGVDENCFRS